MKKQFKMMAVAAIFLLVSCKKDRVCKCESTDSYTWTDSQGQTQTSNSGPSTSKTEYKKVKKSDIRLSCADMNSSYKSTSPDGNSTSTSETKCEIE